VYAVLSGINSAIVRLHDRTTLFREACRIAVEQGGFGIAWIGEVDADSMEIVPVAWTGIDDQLGAERLSARDDAVTGQGAVGRAVRNGIPLFINDLSKIGFEGRRRAEALRRGYHALIALPLSVERRVVAVLVLYAQERDFFTGEELTLLGELANDISFALEYIGKQDRLAYLAYHDVLTGLPNRPQLHERLAQTLEAVRVHPGERVSVVLWNIDRFRNINDTVGRQAGDSVLRELARRLQAVWPNAHDVARVGVDHFAGFVAGRQEITEIAHLVERVGRALVTQPVSVGEQALHLSITAGIAVSSGGEDDADLLVRNAEAALRRAKRTGVRYRFYRPDMNALVAETLMLENRLRSALERDEFILHYQPKVNGANGRVTGLEALIRWRDPVDGLVQPATFIPILEETGMILQAGIWVIRKALSDARGWRRAGIVPPRIAVNVSAIQLQQKDFVASVRHILAESGEALPAVDLEITESMLMTDLDENIARLGEIRGMGVDIAIDDFGTGYSSLGYLARLPVSALKIDRSFIEAMAGAPENKTIVSTIISLAHSLDLNVIAEGVEEEAQAAFLRRFKCNELQGYLISRPLPPERVVAFVRAHGHQQRPH
jgi:diguanylate cyclase (GGDEF)-like protein